jgi:hypothetical protein
MSEQQRVAIVTGAAGGIGRELVLGLLGKEIKAPQSTALLKVSPNLRKQCRSGSNPPTS